METGAKSNADDTMQRGSQAVLWQFKNLHIPKRKKTTNNAERQTINNPTACYNPHNQKITQK
jgi:hypothetical protein